jgi:hypothetical protein
LLSIATTTHTLPRPKRAREINELEGIRPPASGTSTRENDPLHNN